MTTFNLPSEAEATEPPEWRGVDRDGVRMLVASPDGMTHRHFRDLPDHLEPGDLLVVNTSATLPAAVDGGRGPDDVGVHVATQLDDGDWVVELRKTDGSGPHLDQTPGEHVQLPGHVQLKLLWPYPDPDAEVSRLWRAAPNPQIDRVEYLAAHGRPVTYGYVHGRFPLSDYQNVYAAEPGSAEMPSAGRPFSADLLVRLMARGVIIAPIVLHAGVSSPERHEPPAPERFTVPASTARQVALARSWGQRIVAVGTTVARALETTNGAPGNGWTDLVLGPDRPTRVVNGLVTGLHDPEASHLQLLEAVAGKELVDDAYAAAVDQRYLWHEFGDSMLLLP